MPSETLIRKKFGDVFQEEKGNLLDSNQIQLILNEFKEEFSDDNGEVYVTIAYDSATFDPLISNDSNLFVFNVLPLDGTKSSFICHISQNAYGKTDEGIKSVVKQIMEAGEKSGIHFLYVATDCEKMHNDFFKFVNDLNTVNFDQIIDNVSNYPELIPVSDFLHILKDLRTRFSTNNRPFYKKKFFCDKVYFFIKKNFFT